MSGLVAAVDLIHFAIGLGLDLSGDVLMFHGVCDTLFTSSDPNSLASKLHEISPDTEPPDQEQDTMIRISLFHIDLPVSRTSFSALAPQWLEDDPAESYQLDSYELAFDRKGRINLVKVAQCDSYQAKQLSDVGYRLAKTIEPLVEVVKVSFPAGDEYDEAKAKFTALEPVLRAFCREIVDRHERISNDLNDHPKFLELAKDSRFKDLGVLLYDFFGVVVLLGAIVAILVLVLLLAVFVKDKENRFRENSFYEDYTKKKVPGFLVPAILIYGGLVLSSFIVSMFVDVDGSRILGYGTAVALVPVVAVLLLLLISIRFVRGVEE
ncbi:hypothetical protein B0H63DRAFT_535491 [Podospora didyma]|uniref:Uncharacterized protein n=1 Tax=Podospora didyma TaxID=330526 RepID=A0AAE0K001_9PEZI|nr:hypothetical protein B0H63DRAFT_535491 [Podospora didyma]